MVKMLVQVTRPQKVFLESLRKQGTTASGYIRSLLDKELNHALERGRKGGKR